jgi:elongation factor G
VEVMIPHKDPRKPGVVKALTPSSAGPLCALAFKVAYDGFSGATTYLRVFSGTVEASSVILNSNTGTKERLTRLLLVHADTTKPVESAGAGSIVAAVGLKQTRTGDTLTASHDPTLRGARLTGIDIPEAVFTCSIEARSSQDEKEFDQALEWIQKEDPSVRVMEDADTGQRLLSGMGELHLEIVCSRLMTQYKVEADTGPMMVTYKERPTAGGEAVHALDRVMGGKQQSAHAEIEVQPIVDGASCVQVEVLCDPPLDYEVEDAVREGIAAACSRGVVKGYPLVGLRVLVKTIDRPVESSLGAVALCASECTMKILEQLAEKHTVSVLQPIMSLEVTVSNEDVGTVITDLTGQRHATVFGVDAISNTTTLITAQVALPGMLGYDSILRKLTSGTGAFSMAYESHQEMTDQQIVALQL